MRQALKKKPKLKAACLHPFLDCDRSVLLICGCNDNTLPQPYYFISMWMWSFMVSWVCKKNGMEMRPVFLLILVQTSCAGEEPAASALVSDWCQTCSASKAGGQRWLSSPGTFATRGGGINNQSNSIFISRSLLLLLGGGGVNFCAFFQLTAGEYCQHLRGTLVKDWILCNLSVTLICSHFK